MRLIRPNKTKYYLLNGIGALLLALLSAPEPVARAGACEPGIVIGGRLHVDSSYIWSDHQQISNSTDIRRARLNAKGDFCPDWSYKIQGDFANQFVDMKDVYIKYQPARGRFILGQQKLPFSLEELMSSNDIALPERALPNTLVTKRKLGAQAGYFNDERVNWYSTTGIELFGPDMETVYDKGKTKAIGLAARVTAAHMTDDSKVFHVGAAVSWRKLMNQKTLQFNGKPGVNSSEVSLVSTGPIASVDYDNALGVESAFQNGALRLQGEWIGTRVHQDQPHDLWFHGGYVLLNYIMTGEQRRYSWKQGEFKGIKPQHHYGALETSLRVSGLNLNSSNVKGGEQYNLTAGVNWYPAYYMRMMVAYIKAFSRQSGVKDNPSTLMARAQIVFSKRMF